MSAKSSITRFFITLSLLVTSFPLAGPVHGQDIVASDDLTSGSSVFVFRESRKKPQERSASGRAGFMSRGKAGMAGRKRMDQHIAANWRRKRTPSAANSRAAQTAALKRRIAASNALSAQADKSLDNKETDRAIAGYRDALK